MSQLNLGKFKTTMTSARPKKNQTAHSPDSPPFVDIAATTNLVNKLTVELLQSMMVSFKSEIFGKIDSPPVSDMRFH